MCSDLGSQPVGSVLQGHDIIASCFTSHCQCCCRSATLDRVETAPNLVLERARVASQVWCARARVCVCVCACACVCVCLCFAIHKQILRRDLHALQSMSMQLQLQNCVGRYVYVSLEHPPSPLPQPSQGYRAQRRFPRVVTHAARLFRVGSTTACSAATQGAVRQ